MAANTLTIETNILRRAQPGKRCGFAAVYEPAAGKPFGRKSWPKICKFQVIKYIQKMKRHHISSFLVISSLLNSLRLRVDNLIA